MRPDPPSANRAAKPLGTFGKASAPPLGVAHRKLEAPEALWNKERQGGAPKYHIPAIWDTPGACKLVYLGGGNGPRHCVYLVNFIL